MTNKSLLIGKKSLGGVNLSFRDIEPEKCDLLVKKALEMDAIDAKIIPISKVFVEKGWFKMQGMYRLRKKLTCHRMFQLLMSFGRYSTSTGMRCLSGSDLLQSQTKKLQKLHTKHGLILESKETREKAAKFWSDYFDYSKKMALAMLELEKTAFNEGFTFAVAFVNGSCRLCEKCNVEKGICIHSNMARIPEHAVGINMKKTAAE